MPRKNPLLRVPPRWLSWFTLLIGLASYLGFLLHPTTNGFGPDSWSYFDLSQTVFGDFYRPATTRSFSQVNGYSRSFPPLWPIVLAVVGKVISIGPSLATAMAALAALATIIPLRLLTASCFKGRVVAQWSATGAWLGLLWFPAYWAEVRSGGSIPLTVFCMTLGLAGSLRGHPLLAGMLWGAACLTRFDAGPVCALFLAATIWRFRGRPFVAAGVLLAFGVMIAPWVLYSEAHYGSFWSSDNSAVVNASSPVYVQDFRGPTGTLRTEPLRWVRRVSLNGIKLTMAVGHAVVVQPLFLLALAAALSARRWPAWPFGWPLVGSMMAALSGLAGCVLTGYVDRRYFSLLTVLAACWVIGCALHSTCRLRLALTFAALLSPFSGLEWLREEYGGGAKVRRLPDTIHAELQKNYRHGVVLADSLCYEAGARTRVSMVCLPTDWAHLSDTERRAFFTQFGITHAVRFEGSGYRIAANPQPNWPVQDR